MNIRPAAARPDRRVAARSAMNPRHPLKQWAGCLVLASGLVSCDRGPDPGLMEKAALLEAELRVRDERIGAMEEEARQAAESADSASRSAMIDLDAAKSSYTEFVETVRENLQKELGGAKIERTSVFQVEGPDTSHPITSRVAFQAAGGRGEIVVPLQADPSGQWQEPDLEAVLKKHAQAVASAPARQSQPQPPSAPQRPQVRDVMGAARTHEVDWGDRKRPATPPPPSAPARPQRPQMPQKPMQSDRDVIIEFDD